MIHKCNVNCYTMDPGKMESLGIKDDGKWLPFIFNMSMVEGAKMTSDERDLPVYNCTTIFTKSGEVYIIDTPSDEFFKKFEEYSDRYDDDDDILPTEDDLNL